MRCRAGVLDEIVAHADGVPLFAEELVKSVVDARRGDPGAGHDLEIVVPTTLQGSLMGRLDRLSSAKQIAQLGATIGREFSHALISAVSGLEASVLRLGLEQLIEADVLFRSGGAADPHYTFKHALLQDTAYESQLRSTRRALHGRIAEVLEAKFPRRAAAEPQAVAQHASLAGQNERALVYFQKAGELASNRLANAEAIDHYGRALSELEALPAAEARDLREAELRLARLGALASRGYEDAGVHAELERLEALNDAIPSGPARIPIVLGLAGFRPDLWRHRARITPRAAAPRDRRAARDRDARGGGTHDPRLAGDLHGLGGRNPRTLRACVRAHRWRRTAAAGGPLRSRSRLDHPGGVCDSVGVGRAEGSGARARRAGACSRRDVGARVRACVDREQRPRRGSSSTIRSSPARSPATRSTTSLGSASTRPKPRRSCSAAGRAHARATRRALTTWTRGLELFVSSGALGGIGQAHLIGAESLSRLGRPDAALRLVDEAERWIERTGEYAAFQYQVPMYRAEIQLDSGSSDLAGIRALLLDAIEAQRAYGSPWMHLRSCLSLARVGLCGVEARDARATLQDALAALPADPTEPRVRFGRALDAALASA